MPLLGQEQAEKALTANLSERYLRLDRLDAYVQGTQYCHRTGWFEDTKPLHERAPCIVVPLAKSVYSVITSTVLGENRWPTITSRPGEDDAEEGDQSAGLNKANSERLDKHIRCIEKVARLRANARKILTEAQGTGTAVPIVCFRNGKPFVEPTKAKWTTPKFDVYGELIELEIRYPYLQEYYDVAKKQRSVQALIYRRVIDTTMDTTFLPAKAEPDGREPSWRVDKDRTIAHNFGFVPAVWYPFMADVPTVNNYDGNAPHAHLLDELDALNMSYSQRHRASLYTGDPQYVEIGVDKGSMPVDDGVTARTILDPADKGHYVSHIPAAGGRPARKKGPGIIWRYPNPESKVQLLTLPGDALTSIAEEAAEIKDTLEEAFHIVFLNPKDIRYAAELSGVAIERLMSRQITYCDDVRDDCGVNMLLKLMSLILRMEATLLKQGKSIDIPGVNSVQDLLLGFLKDATPNDAGGESGSGWEPPDLDLIWPPYFAITPDDEGKSIAAAAMARTQKFITLQKAVEKIAPIFNIEDPAAMAKELEADEKLVGMADMGLVAAPAAPGGSKAPGGTKAGTPGRSVVKTPTPGAANRG